MRPLHLVLVFLVAVVIGRLTLEPSGVGLVLLAILLPGIAIVLVAMAGWRAGLLFLAFVVPVAIAARLLFQAAPGQTWLVIVLAPVAAAVGFIAVSVTRTMVHEAKTPPAEREKEEE